jgi:hypothetical protein
VLAGAVAAGAVLGAGSTAAVQGGDDPLPATTAPTTATTVPVPASDQLLLAWTSGGLPDGLAEAAAAIPGVSTVVVIRGGPVGLTSVTGADGRTTPVGPPGFQVDLDAVAIDPDVAARIVAAADRVAVSALRPGQALLSTTSAAIRGVGEGAVLHLAGGVDLTVGAVVSDEAIGGAEIAVTGLDVGPPRALVVVHQGDRAAVEQALSRPGIPIRFRAPGETPFLRAGDAVLPQAAIKATFGEFAHRDVELDPAWVAANIVTEDIPGLGPITCHRAILPALRSAMAELGQKNLAAVVVRYDGCFVPKRNGAELSRHTWGVAIDLNHGLPQDPRLVEIMERWGFTWGGRWLEPDPTHFEYVRPVTPAG